MLDRTDHKTDVKLELLRLMCLSREGDRREGLLLRQGKGWFAVACTGHEPLAAVAMLLSESDYLFPYYRDRAMALAKGVTNREFALDYFAKRSAPSGGRQLPNHPSSRKKNVWNVPTVTASCLLPACGAAWTAQLQGRNDVVVATIGDAATRQGEFYEAVAFALQCKLPIVFVVEDNGYGISTPTESLNPFHLGLFDQRIGVVQIDGRHCDDVLATAETAIDKARRGDGPTILHCRLDRLCDHTSSDDQRVYRSQQELAEINARDPIPLLANQLIQAGRLDQDQWDEIQRDIREQVDREYLAAEQAEDPRSDDLLKHQFGPQPQAEAPPIEAPNTWRMVDALNRVFHHALEKDRRYVFFGQDVEDPKGGVFGLTAGLSTAHKDRVFNSPLAEATIAGVACGMACCGMRPVFEIQFVDFIGPAINQISQNLATIRWRSFGDWPCPAILYAPYGAYFPGGGLWHSQANEASFAHMPGLRVVVPSTPQDAAGLMWTAMHCDDPIIFLIPKHRLRQKVDAQAPIKPVPLGKARIDRQGKDVTLVTWGNCIEPAQQAAEQLADEVSVEIIDLRTIVPWDQETVARSLAKTGRLVVVQEDTQSCSVGQMIVSQMTGNADTWSHFISPPRLVSRGDVPIGFHPVYEYAALPDCPRVVAAIRLTMEE